MPTATLESVNGDVSYRTGDDDWCDAVVGLELIVGDEIHTGPESEAVVTFRDGSFVKVRELTETAIGEPGGAVNRPKVRMLLKLGEVAAKVNHEVDQEADFAIRTPTLTASVRGTEFVVVHDFETRISQISVDEGVVMVTPANTSLNAGQPLLVPAHGYVEVSMEAVKCQTTAATAPETAQWCRCSPGTLC